jgi:alpha-D-ribose 1-methylphosphonate 5-triphosphate diphosphatase
MEAARCASDLGMATVMGAPNLVRAKSLWGNLSARRAVSEGVVTALCTDYHPPSLLSAAFLDGVETLPRRVARLTKRPADAVGLSDRGRIEPGARADLVVVDTAPVPTVERVIVAGEEVYRATPHSS